MPKIRKSTGDVRKFRANVRLIESLARKLGYSGLNDMAAGLNPADMIVVQLETGEMLVDRHGDKTPLGKKKF